VPVEGGRLAPAHDTREVKGMGWRVWPAVSSRAPCSDGAGPGRRLMPVLSARIQSCAGKRPARGGTLGLPELAGAEKAGTKIPQNAGGIP